MNMKKWVLLVTMIGVLLVTAFASDKDETRKNRIDLLKERRAYFKENIKPKVDAQRTKLEASISQEDKKEIERLREEIISQRLLENEFLHEARVMRIKGEEVSEDLTLELQAQRIVIENLYDEAKLIANKYRPEIDDLLAELKSEREAWREGRRPHGTEFKGRKGGKGPHGSDEMPPMGRRFDRGSRQDFGVVTFLLWDVNRG